MLHGCSICKYQTHYKSNLIRHIKTKHESKAPNGPRAPTTVSAAACESKAPSPDQMEVPEVRPHATNQVHHSAPNQHQQYNDRSLRSSEGSSGKFDRFYQALHGEIPNVNQSSEINCGYPQCTREWSNDIDKVCREFNNIGVECFTKCSDKEVNSVCFIASTMMISFVIERLKDYRPRQYKDACQLLKPSGQLVEQLACQRTSVQEKRKILQTTNLGAMLMHVASRVIKPTLFYINNEEDILNRFFR